MGGAAGHAAFLFATSSNLYQRNGARCRRCRRSALKGALSNNLLKVAFFHSAAVSEARRVFPAQAWRAFWSVCVTELRGRSQCFVERGSLSIVSAAGKGASPRAFSSF